MFTLSLNVFSKLSNLIQPFWTPTIVFNEWNLSCHTSDNVIVCYTFILYTQSKSYAVLVLCIHSPKGWIINSIECCRYMIFDADDEYFMQQLLGDLHPHLPNVQREPSAPLPGVFNTFNTLKYQFIIDHLNWVVIISNCWPNFFSISCLYVQNLS